MHPIPVDADDRLRQKGGGATHTRSNLAADEFVELNLVRSSNHLAVAVVDLEL